MLSPQQEPCESACSCQASDTMSCLGNSKWGQKRGVNPDPVLELSTLVHKLPSALLNFPIKWSYPNARCSLLRTHRNPCTHLQPCNKSPPILTLSPLWILYVMVARTEKSWVDGVHLLACLWVLPKLQAQQDSITEDSKTKFPLCREASFLQCYACIFLYYIFIMYSIHFLL